MKRLMLLTLLTSCILTAMPAFAAIIIVPDEEANLRDALAVAEPADTIMVEDEEYDGGDNTNLTIDSPVTIMSVNGPDNCIFNVGGEGADWLTIQAECTIQGLTINNALNTIIASGVDNISIVNCVINQSSMRGIWLQACEEFEIIDCQIIENGPDGEGVRTEACSGIISNCIFDSNDRNGGSGGGLYMRDTNEDLSIIIEDCLFNENVASAYGGGIYMTGMENTLIKNCEINNNSVEDDNGGGICITGNSNVTIEGCIISGNETPRSGGGFYISGESFVEILHSFIVGNIAGRSGAGLFVYNGTEVDVFNCVLTENVAGIDGGGLALTNNSIGDITNCDFVANASGTGNGVNRGMGGGIYSGSGTVSTIMNCILIENEADLGEQIYAQNAIDLSITYTCIEDGINPDGDWEVDELIDEENIQDEPGITNGTDPIWGLNGFFLNDDSPCIDEGSEAAADIGLDTLTTQEDFIFDEDVVDIGFHYNVRWFDLRGRLFGTVIDAEDDEPLQDVQILTSYGQETSTDENGDWEIANAFAFQFSISATLQGYNFITLDDRDLEIDGESEINFSLTHPEFLPSIELVAEDMDISETTEINFEIENRGNGQLSWSAELDFDGDDDIQPWDLRFSGDPVEGLRSVIIVNEVYVMAIFTRDDGSVISVRNSLGDILYEFDQPGRGATMLDLTWDGELIWGTRGRDVLGFTIEGELITTFDGPRNNNSVITWDSDRQYLWVASDDSDIVGYDLNGNRQETLDHPNGITYSSLAYWADDPDGYNLYILNYIGDNDPRAFIRKMNTDNGGTLLEAVIEPEDDEYLRSGFISNEIIAGSTVFLSVTEREDNSVPEIWHMDQVTNWLELEPLEGALEPEATDELTITLITNAFIEGVYEAEIIFSHNAAGGETVIPISIDVSAEPFNTTRIIPLSVGWNLISANLQPEEPDFRVIAENLVAARRLVMMKDQHGHFYIPDRDFYNMDGWSVEQGYWILVNRRSILEVTGMTVRSDTPIELQEGWQIVGYYPRHGTNPELAFSGIVDNMTIAKDGNGSFYVPEYNFSSIDFCRFGRGYMLNMESESELIWNIRNDEELAMLPPKNSILKIKHPSPIGVTGADMSLLLLIDDDHMTGEIGAFVNGQHVGTGVISHQRCGITIRGSIDDVAVQLGARDGDEIELRHWSVNGISNALEIELISGNLEYHTDDLTIAKVASTEIPVDFALNSIYPNPFNSTVRIRYSTPDGGHITLSVFNLLGREVAKIIDGNVISGHQEISFSADMLSTGVYFVKLASGNQVNIQKITCLK